MGRLDSGPSGLRRTWAAPSHDWQPTDAGCLVPIQTSQDSGPWVSTGWGANSLPRTLRYAENQPGVERYVPQIPIHTGSLGDAGRHSN